MFESKPFLKIATDNHTALSKATRALRGQGFNLIPSFNLQVARAAHHFCSCPRHGIEPCDCQLVVLLVYDRSPEPVTVVVCSSNDETCFEIVDTPQQPANPHLKDRIRSILSLLPG